MWVCVDRFAPVLMDAALATTAMLSVVVLALLLCRQPARRITVARPAILMAVLMLPLVASGLPPRFHPLSWLLGPVDPITEGWHGWPGSPWPSRGFCLAYLATVGIGLLWLLLGFWGLARLIRSSRVPRPRTQAVYQALIETTSGLSPAPGLRVSERLQAPVLTHLGRPCIVLPSELDRDDIDEDSLRWVLVHEMAHAQEKDPQLAILASLAQTLWAFVPFIHWMRGQIRIDQEFLADQRAVALAGSSARYATRLVSMAPRDAPGPENSARGNAQSPEAAASGDAAMSPLFLRVLMLLRSPYALESHAPRGWAAVATLLVFLLGVLCSCLTLSPAEFRPGSAVATSSGQPSAQVFQVDHFLASPHRVRGGRSLPYILPLPLPARFELSVEIEAPSAALAQVRLAGIPLGYNSSAVEADQLEQTQPSPDPARWHRVRLRRSADRIDLTVEDQAIPVDPVATPAAEWLTVEPPPDEAVTLRNLIIRW